MMPEQTPVHSYFVHVLFSWQVGGCRGFEAARFGLLAKARYRNMMLRNGLPALILAGMLLATGPGPALAKDATAPLTLPGVDTDAGSRVVQSEPDGGAPAPNSDGWVRVGDWDLKVSGKVEVDIRTRPIRPTTR